MAKKSITLKNRIKSLLISDELLRDSDFKLIAKIWYQDLTSIGLNPKNISGYQLLEIISHHKLSSPQTIVRHRRRIQSQNPDLTTVKTQYYETNKNYKNTASS